MGLFARLLQPATTDRYCLPYDGQNLLLHRSLATATDFLKTLGRSRTTNEEKYSLVMSILIFYIHSMKSPFGELADEYFNFDGVLVEFMKRFHNMTLSIPELISSDDEYQFICSNLATQGNKNKVQGFGSALMPPLYIYRTQLFAHILKKSGIDARSFDYVDIGRDFMLSCMRTESKSRHLMTQLSQMLMSHNLQAGLIPSKIMEKCGTARPVRI